MPHILNLFSSLTSEIKGKALKFLIGITHFPPQPLCYDYVHVIKVLKSVEER